MNYAKDFRFFALNLMSPARKEFQSGDGSGDSGDGHDQPEQITGSLDFLGLPILVRIPVYKHLGLKDLQSTRLVCSDALCDIDDYVGLVQTLKLRKEIPEEIQDFLKSSYFENLKVTEDCRHNNLEGVPCYPKLFSALDLTESSAVSSEFATSLLKSCINVRKLRLAGIIHGGLSLPEDLKKFIFNHLKILQIDACRSVYSPLNLNNVGKCLLTQKVLLESLECPVLSDVSLDLMTYKTDFSEAFVTNSAINFIRRHKSAENIRVSIKHTGLFTEVEEEEIPINLEAFDDDGLTPPPPLEEAKSLKLLLNITTYQPWFQFTTSLTNLEDLTLVTSTQGRGSIAWTQYENMLMGLKNLVRLSLTLKLESNIDLRIFGQLQHLRHLKMFNRVSVTPSPILFVHQAENSSNKSQLQLETLILGNFQLQTNYFNYIAYQFQNLKYFATSGRYDFQHGVMTGIPLETLKNLLCLRTLKGIALSTQLIRVQNPADQRQVDTFTRRALKQFIARGGNSVVDISEEKNELWWVPRSSDGVIASRACPILFNHSNSL